MKFSTSLSSQNLSNFGFKNAVHDMLVNFFHAFLFAVILCLSASCSRKADHQDNQNNRTLTNNSFPSGIEEPLLLVSDFDTSGIKPGDIILKKGRGPLSAMIVEALKEKVPVSHCGIFVRQADSLCIIHSVSKRYGAKDGVQTIAINEFLKDCVKNSTLVMRYKGGSSVHAGFARHALRYASHNVPFDIEARNEDSLSMSCAELIFHASSEASDISWTRIKVGNVELLGFQGLQDSAVFSQIKRY